MAATYESADDWAKLAKAARDFDKMVDAFLRRRDAQEKAAFEADPDLMIDTYAFAMASQAMADKILRAADEHAALSVEAA